MTGIDETVENEVSTPRFGHGRGKGLECDVFEEYIIPNPLKKLEKTEDSKGNKRKGQNLNRPKPIKFNKSSKLCPTLISVEESADQVPVCTFPKCVFRHDVENYIKDTEPMISDSCYVFENRGFCPRGITCKFRTKHIKKITEGDWRNLCHVSLKKPQEHIEPFKELDKNLQSKLRKKSIDFSSIDKLVNDIFQERESRLKAKEEFDKTGASLSTSLNEHPRLTDGTLRKQIDWNDKLYLAPLTTVGNLPFRRICKKFGADITCGEMAMGLNVLQGHYPEWALLKKHESEDLFGIQLCGRSPDQMARVAHIVEEYVDCDFVDINMGCPIDLVYNRGMGSGLMARKKPLEVMLKSMKKILSIPLTIKIRTGIYGDKKIAHSLIPEAIEWGADLVTLHGRSREQRYYREADWNYISECVKVANNRIPIYGNGDILNFETYNECKALSNVNGVMIARGALIKPWIFTEIKEQRHWDITAQERLEIVQDYANYGLEHWGSDSKGVENTRRFLLEWLSFLHRYVPLGIQVHPPQKINERIPFHKGRDQMELLLASQNSQDWIKITEMYLGIVPDAFHFEPKHKAHSY